MDNKWKGKRRAFAEALIAAKPQRLSNRDLAVLIGCPAKTAASAGSRLANDPLVRDYVRRHWADYYGDGDTGTETSENDTEKGAERLSPAMGAALDMGLVKGWLANLDTASEAWAELVQLVCRKLGATGEPLDYWDSVLINPYASAKEKAQAAADKARYTMAKPASKNAKDAALEKMVKQRGQQQPQSRDLFGSDGGGR